MAKRRRKPRKLYVIYDERGLWDTDRAAVLAAAYSLGEAIVDSDGLGRVAIYSYRMRGNKLVNETFECMAMGGVRE